MSTTWEISVGLKDIVFDRFGNFNEITDKTKLEQDVREFLLFSLTPIIGNSGSISSNKNAIDSKIRYAIESLKRAQAKRIRITPASERIKSIKKVFVNLVSGSKAKYSFIVEIVTEEGTIVKSSGSVSAK